LRLFRRIVNAALPIRRLNLTACNLINEGEQNHNDAPIELDLFADQATSVRSRQQEEAAMAKERRLMEATIALKKRFGKNSLLKGTDFEEGATARERNQQIGGHRA